MADRIQELEKMLRETEMQLASLFKVVLIPATKTIGNEDRFIADYGMLGLSQVQNTAKLVREIRKTLEAGAEPAATGTSDSENTQKDSACPECSRLASRVEELEKVVRAIADRSRYDLLSPWKALGVIEQMADSALAKHSGSLDSADSASNTKSSSTAKGTRE